MLFHRIIVPNEHPTYVFCSKNLNRLLIGNYYTVTILYVESVCCSLLSLTNKSY